MFYAIATLLLACTGTDTDTQPTDTADTGDTAEVIDTTPVWSPYRIESSSTLSGIYASGAGVYVVGSDGFAWEGGAGGWSFMDIDVDGADITDLWGQGKNDDAILAASTSLGTVAQYSGTGGWTTGTMGDTSELKAVGGDGPNSLFAVGWGKAWSYDGTVWSYEQLPDQSVRLNDVYGEGSDAFAVGEDGECMRRKDATWAACKTGVTTSLNGIDGSSAKDVWAVGEHGTVVHWDGSAWELEEVPTTETLWAVFVPEAGTVITVGSNGIALRLQNGAWERLYTGVDNALYAVHGVSGSNVWASGNRGMVLQFKEG
jgi:hypothetical protein